MKKVTAAFIAIGLVLSAGSAADARSGGGGRGFRGPLVTGHFYAGRGYWDGHRYWARRLRSHGGWRYRN